MLTHTYRVPYLPNGKAYEVTNFKLGTRMDDDDPHQSQVKDQGLMLTSSVRLISASS